MTNGQKGQGIRAASLPLMALALSMAGSLPARAQDSNPAPSSSRPLDFRLPPADEGRAPGVQGPSDNGLPPVAPGERRGQSTPTPAPTPVQPAPPRVTPTQPAIVAAPAPARRDSPTAPAPRATTAPNDTAPGRPAVIESPPLLPLDPTAAPAVPAAEAAPVVADDAAATPPAPADAPSETPIWVWFLAVLAAAGAGFWYWRRRAALVGPMVDEVEEAPRPAAPRPATRAAARPAAPPPRPAAPQPARAPQPGPQAAHPLVTRVSGEKRAVVGMALDVRSIRFAADHVAVGFALNLLNQGDVPATGLMVRIALNQGSAMTEPVLGRFFDGAGGSVLRDNMVLGVGAGEELSTEVMLPRAAIEPLIIGGKAMLVPVLALDVTYHWDGEGEAFGQNAGSFVLGREQGASGSEKLAPLPLDRASYQIDRPGARATAIKRSQ